MREGWAMASLGEIGTVVTGTTPKTTKLGYYGGDVPFIAPGDLGNGLLVRCATKTLTEEGFRQAKPLPEGAVLFTCIGATIGKAGIAARPLATNQQINAIICDSKKADNFYVYYYLTHRADTIRQLAGTQAVPIVNKSTFEEFPIPLPPLAEQREIAAILRTWDKTIEKLHTLIQWKQKLQTWLRQRLIDHETARQNWVPTKLGDVIFERHEYSNRNDEFPALTSSRKGIFLQSDYFTKKITSKNNAGYKIIRRGDFTFRTMSDDGLFVFNRLLAYEAGIVSPAYSVFYANGAYPEFMLYFLNSGYFARLLASEMQGGTRKALRFSALAKMEVLLPDLPEQKKIAEILNASNAELALIEAEIEALSRQKRGLMQKLLTGEWRVQSDEANRNCTRKEAQNAE